MRISDWSSDVCSSDLRGDLAKIAQRHALDEQGFAKTRDARERIALRREILRELRIMRLEIFDQRLCIVNAEQLGGRSDDAVVEVRRDDGGGVDDGITRRDRVILHRLRNPQRVVAEGRVLAGPSGDRKSTRLNSSQQSAYSMPSSA